VATRPNSITISFTGDSSEYVLSLSNETETIWEYTYGNPGAFDGVGVYISNTPQWIIEVVEYHDLSFAPPDPELFTADSIGLTGWDVTPWIGTKEVTNTSSSPSSIGGTATITFIQAPGKAQNPTPADGTEGVYIRGIDRLRSFQWEAPD